VPIYEYLCEACGTLTERIQKASDPPPRTCPECGSRKIARMMSRTSFQLKGGGWYADLYSSPRQGGADKKDEATTASPGDGAPAKVEAAPAPAAGGGSQGSAPKAERAGRKAGRRKR